MSNCTEVRVLEFRKDYSNLNIEMMEECKALYDFSILYIHVCELEFGFKVKRIGRTTSKGTRVTYEALKDESDFNKYEKKIKEMQLKYKESYGDKMHEIINYIKPILEKESRNI